MNKCLNRFFSLYYIYIFEFLLFFTWIYMIPPVGDRYMERGGINAIEGLFRFSFCQIRWISIANGRALSNIFSYLVDGNIIIRAITNSAMITFGSIICYKIALVEDAKYQNLIMARFFSVLGFIFVGWEIKA